MTIKELKKFVDSISSEYNSYEVVFLKTPDKYTDITLNTAAIARDDETYVISIN